MGRVRIIVESTTTGTAKMYEEINKHITEDMRTPVDYDWYVVPDDEGWPDLG